MEGGEENIPLIDPSAQEFPDYESMDNNQLLDILNGLLTQARPGSPMLKGQTGELTRVRQILEERGASNITNRGKLARKFPKYDLMDNDRLLDEFRVEEALDTESGGRTSERLIRIKQVMSSRGLSGDTVLKGPDEGETSFIEPSSRERAGIRVMDFVVKKYGKSIDTNTDAWTKIITRIRLSKDGHIEFRRSASTPSGLAKDGLIVLRRGPNGEYDYSTATSRKLATDEFRRIIEDGIKETEEREETAKGLPSMIEPVVYNSDIPGLSPELNREVRGVTDPKGNVLPESRIGPDGALAIEERYLRGLLDETNERLDGDPEPAEYIELWERRIGLEEGISRVERQREMEEVRVEQEGDLTRLERIKKYLKENLLGLSALGVTVAAFITSIAIAARGAVVKGAQATRDFGKWLKQKLKNLPSWLASLGNLLYTVLKAGAAGLAWLSKNLWTLVVFAVFLLYEWGKSGKSGKRR